MYDFFLTRRYRTYASDTGGGDSGGWYELPRTTRKLLGADDQCVKDGGIPIDELREYEGETDVDVEYRLKQFPLCRYVAEQISSYRVMSYERTLRTITVILEINIDVLYRQCHLFLCGDGRTKELYTSPCTSLCVSNRDVGRMFVEAWRDYTMQCVYGKCYPTQLRMSLDSSLSSLSSAACDEFNIVDYYRQYLNIDYILSDDMILDFYAFESEDVKKGTNVSRLINTLRQLEIGDHVYPGDVSLFKMMYTCYIEETLKFLQLQSDYNTLVAASSSVVVTAVPPTGDCYDDIQRQQQRQGQLQQWQGQLQQWQGQLQQWQGQLQQWQGQLQQWQGQLQQWQGQQRQQCKRCRGRKRRNP